MPNTIVYEFGDVVLVPFPFTDQTGTKQRPAVVVSSARYHGERPDLVIMAVTSQVRAVGAGSDVAIVQWRQAGLLRASMIKPVITTIERGLVRRKLGRLEAPDRRALEDALGLLLGG